MILPRIHIYPEHFDLNTHYVYAWKEPKDINGAKTEEYISLKEAKDLVRKALLEVSISFEMCGELALSLAYKDKVDHIL